MVRLNEIVIGLAAFAGLASIASSTSPKIPPQVPASYDVQRVLGEGEEYILEEVFSLLEKSDKPTQSIDYLHHLRNALGKAGVISLEEVSKEEQPVFTPQGIHWPYSREELDKFIEISNYVQERLGIQMGAGMQADYVFFPDTSLDNPEGRDISAHENCYDQVRELVDAIALNQRRVNLEVKTRIGEIVESLLPVSPLASDPHLLSEDPADAAFRYSNRVRLVTERMYQRLAQE